MGRLTYLGTGDDIGFAKLNELYAEFERKLGLLMGDKSPLMILSAADLTRDGHYACGSVFQMSPLIAPDRRTWVVNQGEPAYDHFVFTAAADAAVPVTWDSASEIVWCEPSVTNLDSSLEAHTKDRDGLKYFIGFGDPAIGGFVRPQRRYRYAVAELVCELDTHLLIPDAWDKYNLFRIHNLNKREALLIDFAQNHSLTIPAGECRTVRRTSVAGTYEVGNYFWRWRAGDPIGNQMGRVAQRVPERTLEACNITNPSILFRWIELLTSSNVREAFGWETDITDLCDLHACSTEYDSLYARLTSENSLLGDCAIHRGGLHVVDRPSGGTTTITAATWSGFGVPPAALVRLDLDDGACRIEAAGANPTDVVCAGTNLARAGDRPSSIAELPLEFPTGFAAISLSGSPTFLGQTSTQSWQKPTGESVEMTGYVSTVETQPSRRFDRGPMTTVGDLENSISAVDAEVVAAALTPAGPQMVLRQPVLIGVDGWEIVAPVDATPSSGRLYVDRLVTLGASWPSGSYPDTLGLCGRVDRFTGSLPAGFSFSGTIHWEHPDVASDVVSRQGTDIVFLDAPRPADRIPICVQLPISGPIVDALNPISGSGWLAQNPANPVFHCALPPDNLGAFWTHKTDGDWYEQQRAALMGAYDYTITGKFEFLRIPLTFEVWNHMAWRVNALARCRPLAITDLTFTTASGALVRLVPNAAGLTDATDQITSIRPITSFARVGVDAAQDDLVAQLELTVRNQTDLPADWHVAHDAVLAGGNTQAWKVVIRRTYVVPQTIDGDPTYLKKLRCAGTDRYLGCTRYAGELGGLDMDLWEPGDQPWIYSAQPDLRWVDCFAVAAAAGELGVAFIHAAVGRPLAISLFDSVTPSATRWSKTQAGGYHDTGWFDTSSGTDALDAARAYISGKSFDLSTVIGIPKRTLRLVEVSDIADATFIADGDFLGYSAPRSDTRLDADIVVSQPDENLEQTFLGAAPSTTFQTALTQDPFGNAAWPAPAPSALDLVLWDGIPDAVRSIDWKETRTLGLSASVSAGILGASFAVLTPAHIWTRQPRYAGSSREAFDRSQTYGVIAREPVFHPAVPSLAEVRSMATRDVAVPPVGCPAAFARIVPDLTISLL